LLLAWVLLDAMWLNNRIGRLDNTFRLAGEARQVPHVDVGFDEAIALVVASGKTDLERLSRARVLVVAESEKNQFEALRAKYHLLPHTSVVTDLQSARTALDRADALLFIPDSGRAESRAGAGLSSADIAREQLGRDLPEIVGSTHASLLQLGDAGGSMTRRHGE
jgi:hypothetical protein